MQEVHLKKKDEIRNDLHHLCLDNLLGVFFVSIELLFLICLCAEIEACQEAGIAFTYDTLLPSFAKVVLSKF